MSERKDIWNSGGGKLPEDKLIAYLEGRLPADEQHAVEQWLAEEGMEADALEGLQSLPAAEAKQMVSKANYHLHKTLSARKRQRRRAIKDNPWAWLAIVVILLLCAVAYVVLQMSTPK